MPDNRIAPAAVLALQIFFRSERAEPDVMHAFARVTGIAVESIDHPEPGACGFAMFTQYAEGFELGVLMSWPSGVPLTTPEPDLVEQLARALHTTVLLESIARPATWLTADQACACSETEVEYLEDGIDLKRSLVTLPRNINAGVNMLCPRCEQGDIVAATIRSTRQRLFVCGECEATWFALHEVAHVRFVDYGTYMESIGLNPLWDELELDNAND